MPSRERIKNQSCCNHFTIFFCKFVVHPFNANGCLGMRLFIGILIETISQSQNSCEHTGTWCIFGAHSQKNLCAWIRPLFHTFRICGLWKFLWKMSKKHMCQNFSNPFHMFSQAKEFLTPSRHCARFEVSVNLQ